MLEYYPSPLPFKPLQTRSLKRPKSVLANMWDSVFGLVIAQPLDPESSYWQIPYPILSLGWTDTISKCFIPDLNFI